MHEDKSKINTPSENPAEEVSENFEDAKEDSPEKVEEMKLRSKFPQAVREPPSSFLQKRLQQRKFFDSGDYNMAKAKGLKLPLAPPRTMDPVTPVKKEPETLTVATDESGGSASPTGTEIPTPEKIPARKTSIVQATASKLSPHPAVHHLPTSPLENAPNE